MGRDSGGDSGPAITYKDIPGYPEYQLQWAMMVGYRIVKRNDELRGSDKEPVTGWWHDDRGAAAIMLCLLERANAN